MGLVFFSVWLRYTFPRNSTERLINDAQQSHVVKQFFGCGLRFVKLVPLQLGVKTCDFYFVLYSYLSLSLMLRLSSKSHQSEDGIWLCKAHGTATNTVCICKQNVSLCTSRFSGSCWLMTNIMYIIFFNHSSINSGFSVYNLNISYSLLENSANTLLGSSHTLWQDIIFQDIQLSAIVRLD